ncbi:hypothetical protein [Pseudomonas phage COT4]|uniref:Uncharacterized protein n=1 Tax=Pseudomonas phage M5.1 TaxID=2873460 RepID=A0AAE8XGN9_9CAUD|nr:hypothetical protein QGX13_gp093 [Pseudomonas phage M5.1]UAV89730.1 hypothetical protein M51_149 [Pseudomonas phage M5.1]UGL61330.1 hypothetical protein [Pseudomonas phage COT4]
MRHTEKRFLTEDAHETGSMVCTVETARVKDLDEWTVRHDPYISGDIQIRDCGGRPVNLDFDARGQKQFEKRLKKLDGMIEQLQRMRVQYHEMWWSHLRDVDFKKKELEKEGK